jgi:hypothetical protein
LATKIPQAGCTFTVQPALLCGDGFHAQSPADAGGVCTRAKKSPAKAGL